jgi:cytosine deaminase
MAWQPDLRGAARFLLANARVPAVLLDGLERPTDREGIADIDLLIADGKVAALGATGTLDAGDLPAIDLDRGLVFPCFTDIHTHLDKGHIWPRRWNPDGTWDASLENVRADREANWSAEDVRRRMDFALRCAFAHGTSAIRTHIDSSGKQTSISWPVFGEMREEWRGRIALQASPLLLVDEILDDAVFADVLATVRRYGDLLGTATRMGPALQPGLDRLFRAAAEHSLDLDFHVDETRDPQAHSLKIVAETAIRHGFGGKILAGHCCSIAMQPADEADRTMDLVAEAGVAIVSLPMCNLYLQDRQAGRTPRWRGVTLLHEMAARGVPVMVASDNTRDPFYAYGDLDMVEAFREAVRIVHLDTPFADWPAIVAKTPARWMGSGTGTLAPGNPADLVLFGARTLNELLARPQGDRVVLRAGAPIDRTVPDYRELDDLVGGFA